MTLSKAAWVPVSLPVGWRSRTEGALWALVTLASARSCFSSRGLGSLREGRGGLSPNCPCTSLGDMAKRRPLPGHSVRWGWLCESVQVPCVS